MTTTIDFDALQVSEGPKVTLLANQNVGGGLVGPDFADFSSFASLSVDAKVQRKAVRAPAPSLTVLVEHSDDGLSWSTAETFTFTDDGEQTASLASPKAHVRASASGSGAEWYVKSVNVAPISGGGGGSTPITTREAYGANSGVLIADGDSALLPWNGQTGGTVPSPWLDNSDPTNPVILEAGIYAVSVMVAADDVMTDGGSFTAGLYLDANSDDVSTILGTTVANPNTNFGVPTIALATTYYLPVGAVLRVTAANNDSASARHFKLGEAILQKIT